MPFAHADPFRLLYDLQTVCKQQRLRIARAVGLQLMKRVHEAKRQGRKWHFRVDVEMMPPGLATDFLRHYRTETVPKARNDIGEDAKACCGGMPAVADKVGGAFLQRFMKFKPGDGSPRALAVRLIGAQGDHEHRSGEFIDQSAGHNAQQSWVPARMRQ